MEIVYRLLRGLKYIPTEIVFPYTHGGNFIPDVAATDGGGATQGMNLDHAS